MAITFKAARVNAGLNQLEASRKLGVTKATLTNWENGATYPTILKAKKMAELYGCEIGDFLLQ